MSSMHPKVFEYLIKSYYYVGGFSYQYLLDTLRVIPLSKKFDLEELKEKERKRLNEEKISAASIQETESIIWTLKEKEGKVYNCLYEFIKSLNTEDIYQLLLILLPDTNFKRMSRDNWNSHGEWVKDWQGNLFHYLSICGIEYDAEKRQLISKNEGLDIQKILTRSNLIDIKFEDFFYNKLTEEINKCYKLGAYTGSFVLARKLIENLLIDLLRRKYPPNIQNLEIYFRPKDNRFHDLTILLKNLEDRKEEFSIDKEIIEEFLTLIKQFRPKANDNTHSIIIWGEKDSLDKLQIERMAGLLTRLLNNIKKN